MLVECWMRRLSSGLRASKPAHPVYRDPLHGLFSKLKHSQSTLSVDHWHVDGYEITYKDEDLIISQDELG